MHVQILLKAFCNAGILDEALLVLRRDIDRPDVVCFNTLINAAIRARNFDVLVNVLRE
jgi:pentatricopeptide repeat protein